MCWMRSADEKRLALTTSLPCNWLLPSSQSFSTRWSRCSSSALRQKTTTHKKRTPKHDAASAHLIGEGKRTSSDLAAYPRWVLSRITHHPVNRIAELCLEPCNRFGTTNRVEFQLKHRNGSCPQTTLKTPAATLEQARGALPIYRNLSGFGRGQPILDNFVFRENC